MVKLFDTHAVGWTTPRPIWTRLGNLRDSAAARDAFVRPAILRFANDAFMDELMALLRLYPAHLDEWQAQAETWESPAPTPSVAHRLRPSEPPSELATRLTREAQTRRPLDRAPVALPPQGLKLYQPVHKRFYLVSASLICQRPGLPDRGLDTAENDAVSFVVRRLLPTGEAGSDDPATWTEHAWVPGSETGRWHPVPPKVQGALEGEERIGLFPLPVEMARGERNRILAGLIPVSRRDVYVQAPIGGPVAAAVPLDGGAADLAPPPKAETRMLLFRMQVSGPWDTLARNALSEIARFEQGQTPPPGLDDALGAPPGSPDAGIIRSARDRIQTVSWLVLADFVRFLDTHVPDVAAVLRGDATAATLGTDGAALFDRLDGIRLLQNGTGDIEDSLTVGTPYQPTDVPGTLAEALQIIAKNPGIVTEIEIEEADFDRFAPAPGYPDFLFPLADMGPDAAMTVLAGRTGPLPFVVDGVDLSGGGPRDTQIARIDQLLNGLEALVEAALPPADTAPMPEIAAPPPAITEANPRDPWFTVRCVYERRNCGPRAQTVLSAPTQPFRMASFFDAEAPGRPIRIAMPLDISPASLRRFNKSAGFVLSDTLCGKVTGTRRMSLGDLVLSVLPWPLHKDLPDAGPAKCTDSGGGGIGMFCSLSIPIVTIVAMILMIIIVTLLDIIFKWLPYLFTCLPIPGLKGKRS